MYDGDDLERVLFAFCGQLPGPTPVTSSSNEIRILFLSNNQGNFPGFHLTYEIVQRNYNSSEFPLTFSKV